MVPENELGNFDRLDPIAAGLVTKPKPKQGIVDITPHKGGKATIEVEGAVQGRARIIELSANEGAMGPSPRAMAAYQAAATDLHRYPDIGAKDLRAGLAEIHDLDTAGIVVGNGSGEIINQLVHAFAGPGDEVVYSAHGFLMYPLAAMANGATPVKAPEENYTASVDALLSVVTPKTKLVFLANPNNPTGTYLPSSELRRLRAGLPDDVLFVIDSAYAEFIDHNDYTPGIDLVDGHDNVVMTRTFSKIHGLAALRIGWAFCPANIARAHDRTRGPFNVNAAAQAAGLAALWDFNHVDRARAHNIRWLNWLQNACVRLGLDYIPSVGNFLAIRFAGEDGLSADDAQKFLRTKGILSRRITAYGLPNHLRISVGLEDDNRTVMETLDEFLSIANVP